MKLHRSTLVLVVTALVLGGVVLLVQARRSPPETASAPGQAAGQPVYPFAEADVVRLHIETQSLAVTFERDDQGNWQMTDPEAHPAEPAAIAFLLSRLTTDGQLRSLTIAASEQADFGLEVPYATVEIQLQDGTTHQLILGEADFSGQNAYALVDPETFPLPDDAGEVPVVIVSQAVVNGVNRPLQEWKATVETEATSEPETAPPDDLPQPETTPIPVAPPATDAEEAP